MRTPSFFLAFLTAISLLTLTSASPFAPGGAPVYERGYCPLWGCRVAEGEPLYNHDYPTSTSVAASLASSTPTPVLVNAAEASGTGTALEASSTKASAGSSSGSANAGVALASHGTLFCTALAGLLGMALTF